MPVNQANEKDNVPNKINYKACLSSKWKKILNQEQRLRLFTKQMQILYQAHGKEVIAGKLIRNYF